MGEDGHVAVLQKEPYERGIDRLQGSGMVVAEDFAFAILGATQDRFAPAEAIPPSMALSPTALTPAARSVATRRLFTLPQ